MCGITQRLTESILHPVIRLRRICIKSFGLTGEFFFNAFEVFHGVSGECNEVRVLDWDGLQRAKYCNLIAFSNAVFHCQKP
jgi:hypothetical protein